MQLSEVIITCAKITKDKGFDVSQHRTQLVLIATEIGEALDCITPAYDTVTDNASGNIQDISNKFEKYRKEKRGVHKDKSKVRDVDMLLEELADVTIRVFSYVGGNGLTEKYLMALSEKIEKNKTRPAKHNKAF